MTCAAVVPWFASSFERICFTLCSLKCICFINVFFPRGVLVRIQKTVQPYLYVYVVHLLHQGVFASSECRRLVKDRWPVQPPLFAFYTPSTYSAPALSERLDLPVNQLLRNPQSCRYTIFGQRYFWFHCARFVNFEQYGFNRTVYSFVSIVCLSWNAWWSPYLIVARLALQSAAHLLSCAFRP